jgi:hypothetical protein
MLDLMMCSIINVFIQCFFCTNCLKNNEFISSNTGYVLSPSQRSRRSRPSQTRRRLLQYQRIALTTVAGLLDANLVKLNNESEKEKIAAAVVPQKNRTTTHLLDVLQHLKQAYHSFFCNDYNQLHFFHSLCTFHSTTHKLEVTTTQNMHAPAERGLVGDSGCDETTGSG